MKTDLTVGERIPPMNTDKPTPAPQGSTPGEPAKVDESAEPTVALSIPSVSGDAGVSSSPIVSGAPIVSGDDGASDDAESTVMLSAAETAEPSEATVDLSSSAASTPAASAGSEPTADLAVGTSAAASVPEVGESQKSGESGESGESGDSEESEATVTLTAADIADATVAIPAVEDAEETVALSAGALSAALAAASTAEEESEPTTVISAKSEPTVTLPKPRPAPESESAVSRVSTAALSIPSKSAARPEPESDSTVALPASRVSTPDTEPTVALSIPTAASPSVPAQRSAPDSTVALPVSRVSSPALKPATPALKPAVAAPPVPRAPTTPRPPTVTPPPSEPTVALPVLPRMPAVLAPPAKPLTRRRLLWAIPAVAGTALVGGTIAALSGRDEPVATKTPNLVVSEPPPVPSPTPTTPKPTAPVMKVPVHTLSDFRAVVPGDPFPTDSIALTIDDGPHPEWTPQILRVLEKYHVPALFCMIGNQVLGHESIARDVVTDGHHIANHTWSHPLNVAELSSRRAIKEIARAQDKIYSTTGYAPSLFRAPGGAWSKGLSESVSKSSVIPMDWSTDPRDWSRPGVAHITKRLLASKPGQILLCHDGGGDRSQTLASLKTVIPALQAKGLTFVALV
ncbi:Peptidoglycan/xylan/chitin deacetylase, PgdA/CDA1 family [Actinoplanes derwentensis]|uniref:Peptidoglycan/xylan/chitin deacetylase, PgdA/CDA1 family n=2 Tax=Actinoplanes derwentensis TaxID=113562 RepID=A0A1H1WQ63_9ACTN|nr:Peptidoglycan/xylan/chitin deacetylase, PgdA/CDA1 family [Actinoplanes derwentensis]